MSSDKRGTCKGNDLCIKGLREDFGKINKAPENFYKK